ncbi:hypothetical protein PRZ48_010296 [Zasmidium cellare]|uniref:DUF7587 domain-containing protein n=1 Tax=Zasmidium cellare TaxID=395010 RepID=A0ABR0E879_ZASCE|nr:hypothetical protein PRZ48_010296 [Zasmidium cellare]
MAVSSEDYLYKSMAGLKVDDRDREPNQGLLDAGDRVIQAAREIDEKWKDFWLAALTKCPGGPTLFNPPAPLEDGGIWLAPPRYLFRVSDSRSSGTSNGSFVASIASVSTPDESRLDLLSLDEEEARKRLYGHLTKSTVVGDIDDNLMSWTSSLLFAIQYAIYRSHQLGCHPNDVEIIAVDTSKFHKGQFGRDLELLHRCKAREDGRPELKRFMDMRLRIDYDNGEYLSQGTVDIEGRCCMTTLEELLNAGLYRLYPEFQDLEGATQWTNRVKNLRTLWAQQGATDGLESDLVRSEITQAFCIARSCFSGLGAFDFALMLFVFKNRPVQMSWLNGAFKPFEKPSYYFKCADKQDTKSANILGVEDQGPIEVQRYSLLAEKISSYRQEQSELNAEFFKEIFYRAWPVHRIIEPAQHTMDLDSYIEDRLDEPNFTWN